MAQSTVKVKSIWTDASRVELNSQATLFYGETFSSLEIELNQIDSLKINSLVIGFDSAYPLSLDFNLNGHEFSAKGQILSLNPVGYDNECEIKIELKDVTGAVIDLAREAKSASVLSKESALRVGLQELKSEMQQIEKGGWLGIDTLNVQITAAWTTDADRIELNTEGLYDGFGGNINIFIDGDSGQKLLAVGRSEFTYDAGIPWTGYDVRVSMEISQSGSTAIVSGFISTVQQNEAENRFVMMFRVNRFVLTDSATR